ncbi:hypothetical protein C7B65_22030 [Phormidesmis priestleyi ULC007]|uniref:Armadillo-type fold-containing protein n=1 Tax=Phormidesmis priestleyi ULC007 TaxID=1920490 RepID=A0A2T1D793_9CYAN|nr:hypothetical protein [Phormidesmis priestleyi]PSB16307.1 hypothetical protein C7B65_22030 [Phormidesmis priestleyi ULC007]PZO46994.1 MAG: hypothetical protein DCF14_21130 [Phormidesmis priestleyi]
MAQTSSQWRNLVSLIQRDRRLKPLALRRWSASGGWLLVTGGTIGLLFWNGRLVLATGAGVAVMMLVYLMQDGNWKAPWSEMEKFLQGWNQTFLLAAASGCAATFGIYLAASLWAEVNSPWIATGMLLQQTTTIAALGLLIWQMVNRQESRPTTRLNQILDDLTNSDPLKRLIAVRRITNAIEQQSDRVQKRQMADYLRVMLSREEDTIVRDAVLEGLQALDITRSLTASKVEPIATPIALQHSRIKARRHDTV